MRDFLFVTTQFISIHLAFVVTSMSMQTYKIKHVTNGKALEHVQHDFGVTVINYLKQNNEIIDPTFLEKYRNDYNLECLALKIISRYNSPIFTVRSSAMIVP